MKHPAKLFIKNLALTVFLYFCASSHVYSSESTKIEAECPVTLPNFVNEKNETFYKNGNLAVSLNKKGKYDDRTILDHPDLGVKGIRQKFIWEQNFGGAFDVSAQKLSVDGEPVDAFVKLNFSGYGPDYIPSLIVFPSPGCWKVTASKENINLLELWVEVSEPRAN